MSLLEIALEFDGAASARAMQITEVLVGRRLYQSVEIRGFNGNASLLYDGIYDPTFDLLRDSSVPVYQKRGGAAQTIILEYRARLKQYQIKTAKYRGTDVCFAMTRVASPHNPELVLSRAWNVSVWKGMEESWQECALRVGPVRRSYRLTGLTGGYEYLNGTYSPSNISSALPLFQHAELPQLFLMQRRSGWEVVDADASVQLCSRAPGRLVCCRPPSDSDSFLSSIAWFDTVSGAPLDGMRLCAVEFVRLRHEVPVAVSAPSSPMNYQMNMLLRRLTSEDSAREESVRSADSMSIRTNDSSKHSPCDDRRLALRP